MIIMRCIKPKNRKKRIFDNEIEQMNKKQGLLYAFRTTVYCIGLLLKLELDQCLLFYRTLDSMKRFENQGAGDPSDQDVETMIPQSSEREPQSILRRRKPGIVL